MPERYLGQPLGKYRVETLLGSGGFAWVYKGYDPELEIPVAIKVLKPQFAGDGTLVERFRREASTAAKLRHPNIVKIYSVGRDGDAVYFVMDYLPGGLADKLETTMLLPEEYVIRIGIDVARALGFAHREGVIHRDIKVDNILFDAHGNAVVADFGIARAVSGYTHQTGTNMVVGTPQYFAPEQARAKPLDGRADIYSLGVTLFRAVTGRLPFEGDDWYEIARQHVEEPPPAPRSINPEVSAELERVLLRCLAKSPDERPASGEQLAAELEEILLIRRDPALSRTQSIASANTPTVVSPVTPAPGAPQPGSRLARPLALAALVTMIGSAAVFAVMAGSRRDAAGGTPPGDSTLAGDTVTVVVGDSIPAAAGGDTSTAGRSGGGTSRPTPPVPTLYHLTLTVPTTADIRFNDSLVAADQLATDSTAFTATDTGGERFDTLFFTRTVRVDSLRPGEYRISVAVPALAGCTSATEERTINLGRPGAPQRLTMHPRPCGWLEVTARGLITDRRPTFNLRSTDHARVRYDERLLPLDEPLLLPVGWYQFTAQQRYCTEYNENLRVRPGETHRVNFGFLCPPAPDSQR